jgi:hypothetical protein
MIVKTISTFPPPNTFNKTAEEIVDIMSRPEVSPLGIESGVKMIQYFINRAGPKLRNREELERSIVLLRQKPEIDLPLALFKFLEVGCYFVSEKKLWIKLSEDEAARSMTELIAEKFDPGTIVLKVPK